MQYFVHNLRRRSFRQVARRAWIICCLFLMLAASRLPVPWMHVHGADEREDVRQHLLAFHAEESSDSHDWHMHFVPLRNIARGHGHPSPQPDKESDHDDDAGPVTTSAGPAICGDCGRVCVKPVEMPKVVEPSHLRVEIRWRLYPPALPHGTRPLTTWFCVRLC